MSGRRIIAAAVRVGTCGTLTVSVPPPGRHGDVLHPLWDELRYFVSDPEDQGFLTSDGEFVGREEACRIAREAGQIVDKHGPEDVLLSEDMW